VPPADRARGPGPLAASDRCYGAPPEPPAWTVTQSGPVPAKIGEDRPRKPQVELNASKTTYYSLPFFRAESLTASARLNSSMSWLIALPFHAPDSSCPPPGFS
jgi:hypothetical protein